MSEPIFKHADYEDVKRRNPLTVYLETMLAHMRTRFPHLSDDILTERIRSVMNKRLKVPTVTVLTHPEYGTNKVVDMSLLKYCRWIKNDIIVPAGSCYMRPTEKLSVLKDALEESGAKRKEYKHLQLKLEEAGEIGKASYWERQQTSTKIFNNSIPGMMNSPFNIIFDKPGYNSITSPARHAVMCGYAQVERQVAGNRFIVSLDDFINLLVIHKRACPPDLLNTLTRHGIRVPTVDEVVDQHLACMRYYINRADDLRPQMVEHVSQLSEAQRAFVMYANSMYTLFSLNDEWARTYIAEFYRDDVDVDSSWDPMDFVKTVEGDLRILIVATRFNHIDRMKLDDAIKLKPDGVRKLLGIARHMERHMRAHRDLLSALFRVDIDVPHPMSHPTMIRRSTLVSDTDSVIFTTQPMIQWFNHGEIAFDEPSMNVNALTVFTISQSLEHIFARMSSGMGCIGKDKYKITMKNEFFYPTFIPMVMPKHYGARQTIKEGFHLPKPKMDIKGVALRGTRQSPETNAAVVTFITDIQDQLMANRGRLSAAKLLSQVARFEMRICDSIAAGEKTFLPKTSINFATEYAGDSPEESAYFYYEFWQAVFAPDFGAMTLPSKGYTIVFSGKGSSALQDPKWQEQLREQYPGSWARLNEFLKTTKRQPTRIVMPESMPNTPEIFRSLINYRHAISSNCMGLYLVLRSINLGLNEGKTQWLVSDFHRASDEPHPLDMITATSHSNDNGKDDIAIAA